jgi:dihydropteroate synthase
VEEVCADLLSSVERVKKAGVREEMIILDPGIGFAKNYEENLIVMRNLDRIVKLGYPVLLGTSRKSLIGKTLGLPPHERVEGTAATVAYGIVKGCQIVRVHDVKEMVRVCRMIDALVYGTQVREA